VRQIEHLASRLAKLFPTQFRATRRTVLADIQWMEQQFAKGADHH
jgi:hypothetical protein